MPVADATVVVSSLSHFLDALPHSHSHLSRLISFHVCPFIYILLSFASHSVACLAVFVAEYPHRFEWAWQPFVYVYGIGSMKFPIVWNFDHLAREFCSCTSTFRILHRCNTLLSPCIACLANVDSDKRILLL